MSRMAAEDRRKQILDCAKKLFSEHGYYQTQISDIQNEAGVARGTIYQYFENKEDLFQTLLDTLYSDWKRTLSIQPENMHEAFNTGFKVFKYKIKQTIDFFIANPEYCNILLRVGLGLGGNFDRTLSRFQKLILELVTDYLVKGIKMGRIRPDIDVDLTGNMIGGALLRVCFYYVVTKNMKDGDSDLLAEEFVKVYAVGIFSEKS